LIELLVTTAIIGLLATVGSASYGFVRMKARDAKRVADIRTIRSALETYFEQNSKYPPAPQPLTLGSDRAKVISDAGITPFGGEKGIVYLLNVPANILPGGVPYVYRPKNLDGTSCVSECFRYEVSFSLESPTGEFLAGPHLLTEDIIIGPEAGSQVASASFLEQYLPTAADLEAALGSVKETAELARQAADRPEVQVANKALVAPATVVTAGAGLAGAIGAAVPAAQFGQFLVAFLTQPFLFLFRRKRKSWGTVYDAGTKVPIDLASVRLIDARTNRAVATKVTDKDGRYAFSPRAGSYRLEVTKPGYLFPVASLAGVSDDGKFLDIYHGTLIQVEADGQAVTLNVPVEPQQAPIEEPRVLLSIENKRQLRKALAMSGPTLSAVALAVTPSVLMLLLFLVQLFVYQLFKRLAEPRRPKDQGIVYDQDTRKPIARAVVRILSLPYHKVLETRLTDAGGRYSFRVGNGSYYLTVLKPGFEKTQTDALDFSVIDKPVFIASDLPMRKAKPAVAPPSAG
jgi:hypothetical protein